MVSDLFKLFLKIETVFGNLFLDCCLISKILDLIFSQLSYFLYILMIFFGCFAAVQP